MSRAFRKVGIAGFSTITALLLSFGMIFLATYLSQDVSAQSSTCRGICDSGGCRVTGTDCSGVTVGAAYCRGWSRSGCNDAHGSFYKSNMTGIIDASKPEHWCSTVQADVNGPVYGETAVVVFIGDRGTTCEDFTSCDPAKLDWDCENKPIVPPPPQNNKPVCEGLTVSKSHVTSLTEPITITVRGSDPDNTPVKLSVEAAASGQINRNPGNLRCVFTPISDPEYSFYCGGQKVWKNIGSAPNTHTYTFTTTYKSLMDQVRSLNSGYTGDLEKLGIQLSANIFGSSSSDLCSANIARNNGNGAYFNNGAWDQTCVAKSCNVRVTYTPPAPVNRPPACEWLKTDKKVVKSLDEQITLTVRGTDPDNVPQKLALFAAAGSQINRNPHDFNCVGTPVDHPEYSFYCKGTGAWVQIGSRVNANQMEIKTTYRNLKKMIEGINSPHQGNLNNTGINITANITGSSSTDLCSSNIARNNGNGVYFNNGAWNQACNGGCNVFIKYQPPAPPSELKQCNESCTNSSQCDGSNQCINGLCRNPSCPNEADCKCKIEPPIGLKCDAECTSDSQCVDGNQCISGRCRNASCPDETDCTCPTKPKEPYCGDKTCNQSSEYCENGVSCIDGKSVDCRMDCTYCGDGRVNGNEQCDFNAPNQSANCSKQCTWIEHVPEDTAGFIDSDIAMFGGIGLLAMGMGSVAMVAPLKKRVRFEMD